MSGGNGGMVKPGSRRHTGESGVAAAASRTHRVYEVRTEIGIRVVPAGSIVPGTLRQAAQSGSKDTLASARPTWSHEPWQSEIVNRCRVELVTSASPVIVRPRTAVVSARAILIVNGSRELRSAAVPVRCTMAVPRWMSGLAAVAWVEHPANKT